MGKIQAQQGELKRAQRELDQQAQTERESQESLRGLEQFCNRVSEGINTLTFDGRQQLLRLLVESVRVEDNLVTVETIIPVDPQPGELRTRHPEPVEGHNRG